MDELRNKLDEISLLNRNRYEYVLARADSKTVIEAVRKAGLSPSWYYAFPDEERAQMEQLALELKNAKILQASLVLESAVIEAAREKISGLGAKFFSQRQEVATEILALVGVGAQKKQTLDVNLHVDGLDQILGAVYGSSNGTDAGTDQD